MKKHLFAISLIALALNAHGQERKKIDRMPAENIWPFFIGAGGGISLPTGDYKSMDINNGSAGFAGNGQNFLACFDWDFSNPFGLTVQTEFLSHPVNKRQSGAINIPYNNYNTSSYMGGLIFMIAAQEDNDGFTLGLKALYGSINMTLPQITYNGIVNTPVSSSAKGYGVGIEGRIIIIKRFVFLLNADYIISKHDFGFIQVGSKQMHIVQPSNVANITGGLGIMF